MTDQDYSSLFLQASDLIEELGDTPDDTLLANEMRNIGNNERIWYLPKFYSILNLRNDMTYKIIYFDEFGFQAIRVKNIIYLKKSIRIEIGDKKYETLSTGKSYIKKLIERIIEKINIEELIILFKEILKHPIIFPKADKIYIEYLDSVITNSSSNSYIIAEYDNDDFIRLKIVKDKLFLRGSVCKFI